MGRKKDERLDHDADGIREFDSALPRWWLYGFCFTILFAAAGFTLKARPHTAGAGPQVALTDPDSLTKGRAIFEGSRNSCLTCHRADLGGLVGPNLTDNRWRHGCGLKDIISDIRTGYPAMGMMPFGIGQPLTDEQVLQLASYVISKRGSHPPNPKPLEDRDKPCHESGS